MISDSLAKLKLNPLKTRLIIEKPFGSNKESAQTLDQNMKKNFKEEQIFRIDHYLGKESIRSIPRNLLLNLNNELKKEIKAELLESIEITTLEELGVEERGDFYDPLGALRDVGQNHLLEILSLITIDTSQLDEKNLRELRLASLRKLPTYTQDDVKKNTFRAQYEGYQNIENVKPDSQTETYFKLCISLKDTLWKDVPFAIQAGKRLLKRDSFIKLNFKDKTKIVYDFRTKESITLLDEKGETIMEYKLPKRQNLEYVGEYAVLLKEALQGIKDYFISIEEVLAEWSFVDPIQEAWQQNIVPLRKYRPDDRSIIAEADKAINFNS